MEKGRESRFSFPSFSNLDTNMNKTDPFSALTELPKEETT